MKPGFFIDRPVFSTVLSLVIVIVGIIGLVMLPVDQYPQITPPVVKISASYPGASAMTVSQAGEPFYRYAGVLGEFDACRGVFVDGAEIKRAVCGV